MPAEFFAEMCVRHRPRIEAAPASELDPPDLLIDAPAFPPEFAVEVYGTTTGPTLVAVIELVSPGHKDRPEHRRAFAVKCAAYLQRAVGLVVIDTVTVSAVAPLRGVAGRGRARHAAVTK